MQVTFNSIKPLGQIEMQHRQFEFQVFHMEDTECECVHGKPVEAVNCRDKGIQNCSQCDDNYHLQSVNNTASFWHNIPQLNDWAQTKECILNQCFCDKGYPSKVCTTNNELKCDACHSTGYSLNAENHCVPNSCTCENGTADVNHACEDNGFEDCFSCKPLFHQELRTANTSRWYGTSSHNLANKQVCLRNVCTCHNGETVDASECVTHGENKCKSCNIATDFEAGYHLNITTKNCDINVCHCEDGIPAIACTTDNTNECDECDHTGFTLNEETKACDINVCTCTNGIPHTGQSCEDHNSEDCLSCHGNYHLEFQPDTDSRFFESENRLANKTICAPNKCRCDNGFPVDDNNCILHQAVECVRCNDGYRFTNNVHDNARELQLLNARFADGLYYDYDGHITPASNAIDGNITHEGLTGYAYSRSNIHPIFLVDIHESESEVGGIVVYPRQDYGFGAYEQLTVRVDDTVCTTYEGLDHVSIERIKESGILFDCGGIKGSTIKLENGNEYLHIAEIKALNSIGTSCRVISCSCRNGFGVLGTNCPSNGDEKCASCDDGYYLSNDVCNYKHCTCSNGSGASGSDCPSNDYEKCTSCNSGYRLSGDSCEVIDTCSDLYFCLPVNYLPAYEQYCNQNDCNTV